MMLFVFHSYLFFGFGILLFCFNVGVCLNHLNNLKGRPGEGYYVEIEVGKPPQKLNVLVDTGSSNLAVAGAAHPLVDRYFRSQVSETYDPLEKKVWVPYTQGCWEGLLGRDLVFIPTLSNLVRVRCSIASILSSTNFYMNGSSWQGILGLAYPSISRPSPSIMSWLESVSYVSGHNVSFYHFRTMPLPFSLRLCGTSNEELYHTGDFIVGDFLSVPSQDVPKWMLSPVLKEGFYELLLTGITLDGFPINLPCEEFNNDRTIVDSGTTELRLPTMVYNAVVESIQKTLSENGRKVSEDFWNQEKKTVCWKRKEKREELKWLASFPNITLSLAHTPYTSISEKKPNSHATVSEDFATSFPIDSYFNLEIPPQSYIRRVIDEKSSLSKTHQNCYKFGIESSNTGTVLGITVMEGFDVMFNQSGKVVGFAKSDCGPEVSISGPYLLKFDPVPCTYYMRLSSMSSLSIGAYVVGALITVCGAILLFLVCQGMWVTFRFRYLYLLIPSRKRNSSVVNLVAPEF